MTENPPVELVETDSVPSEAKLPTMKPRLALTM
jgi:hypothetical protein